MATGETGEVLSEREEKVKSFVKTLAKTHAVGAKFGPARRMSDVVLVWFRGQKQAVLALPLLILDGLPGEDLEVLGGSGSPKAYTLRLVVTEQLEAQTPSDFERRAKLLNFLKQESA